MHIVILVKSYSNIYQNIIPNFWKNIVHSLKMNWYLVFIAMYVYQKKGTPFTRICSCMHRN